MTTRFKTVAIEDLIELPSRIQASSERAKKVADLLTNALNRMAESGWTLTTTYRGSDSTFFVFQGSDTVDSE